MRVAEAQSRAEARVTEQKGRSDALVSAVSEQAQARVAEAVARAEAAEAALAVAEADAARSMGPRLQRLMRLPTGPEAHPLAQGYPLDLRGEPSPHGCQRGAVAAL